MSSTSEPLPPPNTSHSPLPAAHAPPHAPAPPEAQQKPPPKGKGRGKKKPTKPFIVTEEDVHAAMNRVYNELNYEPRFQAPRNPNPPKTPPNPNPPQNPQNPNPPKNPKSLTNKTPKTRTPARARNQRGKIVASEVAAVELTEEQKAGFAVIGVGKVWDDFSFKAVSGEAVDGHSLCNLHKSFVGKTPVHNIYNTPPWRLTLNRRLNTCCQSWLFPSKRGFKGSSRALTGSSAVWKNKKRVSVGDVGSVVYLELHHRKNQSGGGVQWFAKEFVSKNNEDAEFAIILLSCANEHWIRLELDVQAAENKLNAASEQLLANQNDAFRSELEERELNCKAILGLAIDRLEKGRQLIAHDYDIHFGVTALGRSELGVPGGRAGPVVVAVDDDAAVVDDDAVVEGTGAGVVVQVSETTSFRDDYMSKKKATTKGAVKKATTKGAVKKATAKGDVDKKSSS